MKRILRTVFTALLLVVYVQISSSATFDVVQLPQGVGTATTCCTEGTSIFVGTSAGLCVYETTTQTWIIGKKPIADKNVVAVAASPTSCMAVASDGTLWFSYDRGTNWFQVQGMEFFSVATTVVCEQNTYIVGAANGVFTVNAQQQSIVRICSKALTGSIRSIAKNGDALIVIQDGQNGRSVILYDGSTCKDVTSAAPRSLSVVEGAFNAGSQLLLDETQLFRWNSKTEQWELLVDLASKVPATFLNVHPTDPVAVVGHGTFLQLIDLSTREIIDPSILADLAMPSGTASRGGFVVGRWTGIGQAGPMISTAAIAAIIEENRRRDAEFTIEVTDDVPTLLANVPYRMYAVTCDDRRLLTSGTIGADGRIRTSLGALGADSNDLVEIEVVVKTETTDKVDRAPGFDTLYVQTIRNRRLNSDGTFTLPQLKSIRNGRVQLAYTMIGFRLQAVIEWNADTEYIDSLKNWLRRANDLMLDVTDGQVYIERIGLGDSKQGWGAKDIAFEASNMVWPHVNQAGGLYYGRAFQWLGHAVYMPRAHYGDHDPNRDVPSQPDWLQQVQNNVTSTLVHELGHHIFGWLDEYCSWLVWNNETLTTASRQGRCFGIMHFNYLSSAQDQTRRMASELSSDRTVWTTGGGDLYSATLQFTTIRKPCWEHFRDSYTRTETISGTRVRSRILRPTDRVLAPGDSIVLGPRDIVTGQNSCTFQPPLIIEDRTLPTESRSGLLRVDNGGISIADIDVDLLNNGTSRTKLNYQGKTSNMGTLRVLGMATGNIIKVYGRSGFDRVTSSIARVTNGEIMVPPVAIGKEEGRPQQDEVLALSTATTDVTERRLFFAQPPTESTSSVEIVNAELATLSTPTFKQDGGAVEVAIPVVTAQGPYELPIHAIIIRASAADQIISHDGRAQFFRAPETQLGGTSINVVSGFVPPPFNGIDPADELLSDLVSISGDVQFDAVRALQIQTWHAAEKGRFAVVHIFDRAAGTWQPLPSYADENGRTISAVFAGAGTYAVFSRPTAVTSVLDNDPAPSMRIAPNPASTRITITTDEAVSGVDVLSIHGDRVAIAQHMSSNTWSVDCSSLANGLYFVRSNDHGRVKTSPVVITR